MIKRLSITTCLTITMCLTQTLSAGRFIQDLMRINGEDVRKQCRIPLPTWYGRAGSFVLAHVGDFSTHVIADATQGFTTIGARIGAQKLESPFVATTAKIFGPFLGAFVRQKVYKKAQQFLGWLTPQSVEQKCIARLPHGVKLFDQLSTDRARIMIRILTHAKKTDEAVAARAEEPSAEEFDASAAEPEGAPSASEAPHEAPAKKSNLCELCADWWKKVSCVAPYVYVCPPVAAFARLGTTPRNFLNGIAVDSALYVYRHHYAPGLEQSTPELSWNYAGRMLALVAGCSAVRVGARCITDTFIARPFDALIAPQDEEICEAIDCKECLCEAAQYAPKANSPVVEEWQKCGHLTHEGFIAQAARHERACKFHQTKLGIDLWIAQCTSHNVTYNADDLMRYIRNLDPFIESLKIDKTALSQRAIQLALSAENKKLTAEHLKAALEEIIKDRSEQIRNAIDRDTFTANLRRCIESALGPNDTSAYVREQVAYLANYRAAAQPR